MINYPANHAAYQARADLLAFGLITLAALIFFAPVWAGGGWLPSGGGDLVSFLWPTYTFAARMIPGSLPLWNPHQYGGAPFWADNQSGVLYPPNLLLFLLTDAPPYAALEALVMFHIWLAGALMYACLRLIRPAAPVHPAAAALGAVAWMFSDVFVTHQGNLNLIAVAAWLPLVFLGTWRSLAGDSNGTRKDTDRTDSHGSENQFKKSVMIRAIRVIRALLEGELRWAVLAGAAFGVGTLAGHAQMTYFTALLIGAAGAWHFGRAVVANWVGGRRGVPLQIVATLLVIAVVGLGIGAAAWIPALEMTGYTARAGLSYADAARYSLPPRALIGLVAPGVYGRGPAAFSGDWDRVEVGYMGVIALALAGWGAWRGLRRRDGLAVFLLIAGVAAMLLALGEYFPLHRLAYEIVPGFKQIRVPARFVLLFNFAGAGLAALALTPRPPIPGPSPTGDEGGSTRFHPSLFFMGQGVGALFAVFVAAELIAFGAGVEVQDTDPTEGYDHADAIAWLRDQPGAPFRVEAATPRWQPDLPSLVGGPLYDIYGISNPLALAAYDAFYWGVGARGTPTYNFLGAKYVVAGDEPPADSTFVPVYAADSGVTVYLNTNALPLAHLVYRAVPVESAEAAWEAVHTPDWNPRETVYVEGGPPLESEPPEGANLFFTVYEPNALAVVVQTPAPAYLVLSETFYPGWQATIDGQPAPIYRANTAFRAVYVDTPGEHTILLAFRPVSVAVGIAITGGMLIGVVVAGWISVGNGLSKNKGQRVSSSCRRDVGDSSPRL